MAFVVEKEQRTTLSHRINAVGRPSSRDTVTWDYEGRAWLVERPDDGSPAVRRSVRCPVCEKALNYTVHSVAATRARRTRRWAWAVSGFVAAAVALPGHLVLSGGPLRLAIALAVTAAGVVVGYLSAYVAARETGFTGHGAGWPVVPKHLVALPHLDPSAPP
ncbi:hypothetical protein [Actinomadura roseirufa]|uniref:hypothetical protein n=1 Tax=Actinomadura roseirufa TaxID=2094049 RepID=UPI0010417129|nr:hypothetical protein [Actinomadura roseirufa]